MKKPWSITTTLRNPERIRSFLIMLKDIEGEEWNPKTQEKYQILLIKHRVYGYGEKQFYNGLSAKQVELMDNLDKEISFDEAKNIFNSKGYEDPAMRGRQSINPLKKLGLVSIKDSKIFITGLGQLLLKDNYDLGEMFFRSFIKWQIPNPDSDDYKLDDGYDIKPFIGTLHLINAVNQKTINNGEEPKGVSKQEFSLFGPTLVNYEDIGKYADEILKLRAELKGKSKQEQKKIFEQYKKQFAQQFLLTKKKGAIDQLLKNLKDYGDNAIRYFRMTRYIYIRGGGFYIDLEPRRQIEISNLLSFDNGQSISFTTKEEYLDYIADITKPKLPWETKEKFTEILSGLIRDIRIYERKLSLPEKVIPEYKSYDSDGLKKLIYDIREYRKHLQGRENHITAQNTEAISKYIETLQHIYDEEDKSIALEKYTALTLYALNDALSIQPNYPVGDDNEPTFTAPAGKPDIECYYKSFNAICEVTMRTSRDQWYQEGQPVMRHLRDFEEKNKDKKSYCLFIAPRLHRDTLNTFWVSVKYEYEGNPQRIIPLSIQNFIELLKTLVAVKQKGEFLPHSELLKLFDDILSISGKVKDVNEWIGKIPDTISTWQKRLTA
ncbi:MAG: AlwI family type II restriction endonuclease [Planctomycetes bacterium]|nr:AlwI family type II restriction endonuclease [Planctomycetota bacterium]